MKGKHFVDLYDIGLANCNNQIQGQALRARETLISHIEKLEEENKKLRVPISKTDFLALQKAMAIKGNLKDILSAEYLNRTLHVLTDTTQERHVHYEALSRCLVVTTALAIKYDIDLGFVAEELINATYAPINGGLGNE